MPMKGIVQQFLCSTKQGANLWYALMEFINNLSGIDASQLHYIFNKKANKITIYNDGKFFEDLKEFCESFKYGNGTSTLNQYHVGIKTSSIILGNCLGNNVSRLEITTKDDFSCKRAVIKFGFDEETPIECISFEELNEEESSSYKNGTTFVIRNVERLVFTKSFYEKLVKYISLMHSPFLMKNGLKIYVWDDENVLKELSLIELNDDGSVVICDRYNIEEAIKTSKTGKKFFEIDGIFYWSREYYIRNENGEERTLKAIYNFVPRSKYSNEAWKDVRKGYYLSMGGEIGYIDGVYVNMLNSLLNYYPETRKFNEKAEPFAFLFNTGGGDRSSCVRILDDCRDIIEVNSEKMKGMINFPDNPKLEEWTVVGEYSYDKHGEAHEVTLIEAFAHDFYKVLKYNKEFDAPKCTDKTCDYFLESNIDSFERFITEYDFEHSLKNRAKGKKVIKNIIEADGEIIDVIDYNNPSIESINARLVQDCVAKDAIFNDEELSAFSKQDRRWFFACTLAYERCKKISRDDFKCYLETLKQIILNDGGQQ